MPLKSAGAVGQAIHVGITLTQSLDETGGVVGRQQAGLPAQQRRRETDHETVPVGTQVQDITPVRKCLCQFRDILQELRNADGLPRTIGEHTVGVVATDERDCCHERLKPQRLLSAFPGAAKFLVYTSIAFRMEVFG